MLLYKTKSPASLAVDIAALPQKRPRRLAADIAEVAGAGTISKRGRETAKPKQTSSIDPTTVASLRNLKEKADLVAGQNEHLEKWQQELGDKDTKYMALNIFRVMVFKLGVTVQEATETTSAIMSLCSETVRRWAHSFYCQNTSDETAIPESKRGCHSKQQSLIDVSEGLKNDARRYVKETSWVKGEPRMTVNTFKDHLNNVLIPSHCNGMLGTICQMTAARWLRKLGFTPRRHAKGIFFDGHDRADVVDYRKEYLLNLANIESSGPVKRIRVYHDESLYYANSLQNIFWSDETMQPIRQKSLGGSIMVSDFVEEHDGFLRVSQETADRVGIQCKEARQYLEIGVGSYWRSEAFLKQVEKAITIFEAKYPDAQRNLN